MTAYRFSPRKPGLARRYALNPTVSKGGRSQEVFRREQGARDEALRAAIAEYDASVRERGDQYTMYVLAVEVVRVARRTLAATVTAVGEAQPGVRVLVEEVSE